MLRSNHVHLNGHLLMAEQGPDPPFPATSGRRRRGACDIRSHPHWVSHKGYAKKKRQRLGGNAWWWWLSWWSRRCVFDMSLMTSHNGTCRCTPAGMSTTLSKPSRKQRFSQRAGAVRCRLSPPRRQRETCTTCTKKIDQAWRAAAGLPWGLLSVVLSVRSGPFHLDSGQCGNQVLKAEILACEMRIIVKG